MKDFLSRINSVDWTRYAGPENYVSEEVPNALTALFKLGDKDVNNDVCGRVLFSIGNDHAGTYYPVIQEALDFIVEIAIYHSSEVAKNCALDILIELYGLAREPELGGYNQITPIDLESKLNTTVEAMQNSLKVITESNIESERTKSLAKELIACITNDNFDY